MNTFLNSFRVKNFKAIHDSGTLKLTPLTVLIGDNGSGKSSFIEALQTLQDIVINGLNQAMINWSGFEHIWHKGVSHVIKDKINVVAGERKAQTHPMSFRLYGKNNRDFKTFISESKISLDKNGNDLFFVDEEVKIKDWKYSRNQDGKIKTNYKGNEAEAFPEALNLLPVFVRNSGVVSAVAVPDELADDKSLLQESLGWYISDWQFLTLTPQVMGRPNPQQRTGDSVRLLRDGSNIAEYLRGIQKLDSYAFEGIIETLQYVLPYASNLRPNLTSELERNVYLELAEADFRLPGWLLSSGTLRILALLAVLRHPTPPPLIVIEEIENGLDPRTINLILEEIHRTTEEGKTQVIVTTHSPYLLDLLNLSQIVLVERKNGNPVFTRPNNQEGLDEWASQFTVGRLYTMGVLNSLGKSK